MLLNLLSIILILKIFLVLVILFHLFFSIVLVQQTKLMIKVVEAGISPLILFTAIIHLFFSFFVLVSILIFV